MTCLKLFICLLSVGDGIRKRLSGSRAPDLGRAMPCPVAIPVPHTTIVQSVFPLVWGYFDAVLGGTFSQILELSLKGTVSFGSKSIRL